MLQRVMSRLSVGIFLSHSAEKNRRRTLLCCLSQNFRWRKSLWIRGGGVSRFSVEDICLTVPKNFVGESFTVAVISGTEKVWIRRGEHQDFPWKIFLTSQCRKIP